MPTDTGAPKHQEWNHLPKIPIAVSPLWQWPPKPLAGAKWYFDSWFFTTVNLVIIAFSFAALIWASSSLATADTVGLWIVGIWLRNAMIVSVLTGALHLWFHNYAGQGTTLKYKPRPFTPKGRMFTFNSQLRNNDIDQ